MSNASTVVKAEEIVRKSAFDKETKQQHQERIDKARESFEIRLASKIQTGLEREARRTEVEKFLDEKKTLVSNLSSQIKLLRAQKKELQVEIRAARKDARS